MADMASRISTLEKSIGQGHDGNLPSLRAGSNTPGTSSPGPLLRRDDHVLVERASSSQYFNEVILSNVIDQVRTHASLPTGDLLVHL